MISSKPSQYIKGFVEFYKLKFKVTPDVLIPRPETELLVDEVLNFARNYTLPKPDTLTILDIGTGAGNIAISIAKTLASHLKGVNVKIIATDVSGKALKVAKQNAKFHGVEDRIEFIISDLLSALCHSEVKPKNLKIKESRDPSVTSFPQDDNFIIVSNLPYIPTARIPYLDSSVKDFEPHVALDGGEDGFELYRKLFAQIKEKNLKPNLLLGEIDYTHGELAAIEAQKFFPKAEVEVKKDLTHLQRILIIKHNP